MKPGDTVAIRQPDGFVSLYARPGPASPSAHSAKMHDLCSEELDGYNPEIYQMQPNDVGLVIAVTEVEAPDCTYTECLVIVSLPDGGVKYGWRETDRFDIMTETELARRRVRGEFQARDGA